MRARCLIALAVALAGCSSPEQRPAGTPTDDSFLTGRDDGVQSPPLSAASGLDPNRVGTGPLTTHWDALLTRQLHTAKGDVRLKEFHRGEHLTVSIVGVAGTLEASTSGQTEILLPCSRAVSLCGVFPPGTRGELVAPRSDPLVGLLLATDLPCPAGTRPYLTSFERLWNTGAFKPHTTVAPEIFRKPDTGELLEAGEIQKLNPNRNHTQRLLTIPGLLSLDAYTIYSIIPVHYHEQQEEFVFFLQGGGSFGLGASGNLVRDGSILLAPPETPHFFEDPRLRDGSSKGSRCLILNVPDVTEDDFEWVIGHPEFEVPEELNYPGYKREEQDADDADSGR